MLKKDIEMLHDHITGQQTTIAHNSDLFCIYEGDLLRFVVEDLKNQLSLESFSMAKKRIPPINVLIRLIDKLSKIYQQNPARSVVADTGSEKDDVLLEWYSSSMDINNIMNCSNEFLNLFKSNLIQPYVYKGMPKLRSIASDSFTVYSDSDIDPTRPTHVITFHSIVEQGQEVKLYYVYTDEEFMIFDQYQTLRTDLMEHFGNPEGVNIAGKIPFVYVNKSKNLLIPKIDTDIKKMTILLPVMLADLNFAVMMQAFSIIYGVDIDDKGIKMSPNAFWRFKSDESTDKTPQLGVLKPQVDTASTLQLIQSEIGLWLQTRGIKPGAVGQLTAENFASGISKMIDEMDTSEERQKQVSIYQNVESELWNLITQHMHPMWRKQNAINTSLEWSPGVEIRTDFSEQLPLLNRGDIVADLKLEMEAGFTSRFRAIKKLNPRMSDAEVEALMQEIDEENVKTTATEPMEASKISEEKEDIDRPKQEQSSEEQADEERG